MNKKTFSLRGMHCRSCEILTEEELLKVPGVKEARTNFRTGIAEVSYDGTPPDDGVIERAVLAAGYEIGTPDRPWVTREFSRWVGFLFAAVAVAVLVLGAYALGVFDLSVGMASPEKLSDLSFVLFLGVVAGLSTCMAIIGGLTLAVSARHSELHPEASPRERFLPNLSFNAGRVIGFSLFGAILGAAGSLVQPSPASVGVMTILVGAVMLLLGLQLLELFPKLSGWKLMLPKGLSRVLRISEHSRAPFSHGRTMVLGALTFFLPCGFTQAVQLFVVTQGNPLLGALTMGTFALGTAPGLLGIGGLSASVRGGFRTLFFQMAGIIVVVLGILNMGNGTTLLRLGSGDVGEGVVVEGSPLSGEVQIVRIVQKADGYYPNEIVVKRGQTVRLTVDSQESYSCAVSLMIPKVGIRKILDPGENVFEFTPEESGPIPFSCSMGMYRGVIRVVD